MLLEDLAQDEDITLWDIISINILRKIAKCHKGMNETTKYISVIIDIIRHSINNGTPEIAIPYLGEISELSENLSEGTCHRNMDFHV